MDAPPTLLVAADFRIAPEAAAMRLVRGQLRVLLAECCFPEAKIEATLLGLDEVLMNACFHGGAHSRGEQVELGVELHTDRVAFEVRDRGEWKPRTANPAGLPDEEAESGRGLFLIQSTIDEVSYAPRDGGGTLVRLVQRRR